MATHFNADLNEDQIEIFIEGLVKDSDYQIGAAFERCLNECEFMPKLRDLHGKMPEERAPRTTGAIRIDKANILDLNREIVRDICPRLYGCHYEKLDTVRDSWKIHEVFRLANIIRYVRMGIDVSKWVAREDVEQIQALG